MKIELSPEVEAIVERDLASGRYSSVAEYIAEAVDALHERQQLRSESQAEVGAGLEAAWQEAERGELMDEDEVRREMQAMKADFLGRQPAA